MSYRFLAPSAGQENYFPKFGASIQQLCDRNKRVLKCVLKCELTGLPTQSEN